MPDTVSCDYCHAAIDTSSGTALVVGLHRGVDDDEWDDDADEIVSGNQLTYRYCGQSHLAAHMERVQLPEIVPDPDQDDARSSIIFAALFYVLALSFVALWAYGIVALVRDVI